MAKGKRYQAQREKFAQALAAGKSAIEAGKIAGYKGAANCRRNANRADVKARVAELLKPHLDKINEAIAVNAEWATRHLQDVVERGIVKMPDVPNALRAIEILAKMNGWIKDGPQLNVETKGRVTLNVSYKREPRPDSKSDAAAA